ncbi:tRNA pseudouridine(65) synthase TruC [Congregibacter litoralis]|uniref:tRNA pseudouridine synthase C n=1 Tax=Congregibacter litoralis KT71 TaxID=314285 RepID=A4A6Z8_9GAMM|nr:tRNA pseudouridine(65) synthase TruC [Congregibacter litoralis]EAQ98067.1 tRNA pseudouridine synthase C [Congregibacter litoralis KT71]
MHPDAERLEIIYRDSDLVVINKPPGLLVHRSKIDRQETRFALQLLRDQIGQHVFPVHRLDKPTSGLLVFALNPEMAKRLADQFARREVSKQYLAVVRGYAPGHGTIDHALTEKRDPIADKRANTSKAPQEALTHYRRLAQIEWPVAVDRYPQARYSLVELRPHTGRKHQLRRHMKHIGHPIIGDANHGKGVHNRFFAETLNCPRLLLACTGLSFDHRASGGSLSLRARPGVAFEGLLATFGWLKESGFNDGGALP